LKPVPDKCCFQIKEKRDFIKRKKKHLKNIAYETQTAQELTLRIPLLHSVCDDEVT